MLQIISIEFLGLRAALKFPISNPKSETSSRRSPYFPNECDMYVHPFEIDRTMNSLLCSVSIFRCRQRIFLIAMAVLLCLVTTSGLSAASLATGLRGAESPKLEQSGSTKSPKARKVVVCSTTQIADFTRQIVGDRWEVICVLGPGADPHTYETRTSDSAAVSRADLCIENGWNLEGHGWMNRLAAEAGKPIVTCVDGVEPLKADVDGESVNDPHAWFDPKNAAAYVISIRNAIVKLDPDNADEYQARAQLYLIQLRALNQWVQEQVNAIPKARRILVTHHDAFGYFAQAFGFQAISPVGWTTEEISGVAIDQRQAIVNQIRELGVKSIFVETTINPELLNGIAKEAGIQIGGQLYSDAMGESGSAGETYIGMMRENVLTIVRYLK